MRAAYLPFANWTLPVLQAGWQHRTVVPYPCPPNQRSVTHKKTGPIILLHSSDDSFSDGERCFPIDLAREGKWAVVRACVCCVNQRSRPSSRFRMLVPEPLFCLSLFLLDIVYMHNNINQTWSTCAYPTSCDTASNLINQKEPQQSLVF